MESNHPITKNQNRQGSQWSATWALAIGGIVFDITGSTGVFTLSGVSWVLSALIVFIFMGSKIRQFKTSTEAKWQTH